MLPIVMFERLLALFEKGPASVPESSGASALQRAAAVLLVIAARLDGHAAPDERESIVRLLRERLGVEDAAALVDEADEAALASTDFFRSRASSRIGWPRSSASASSRCCGRSCTPTGPCTTTRPV